MLMCPVSAGVMGKGVGGGVCSTQVGMGQCGTRPQGRQEAPTYMMSLGEGNLGNPLGARQDQGNGLFPVSALGIPHDPGMPGPRVPVSLQRGQCMGSFREEV